MTQNERNPSPAGADAEPTGTAVVEDTPSGPRDPVTGASDKATGEQQAAENEEADPVA